MMFIRSLEKSTVWRWHRSASFLFSYTIILKHNLTIKGTVEQVGSSYCFLNIKTDIY
jgi:hypothetical protein